MPSPSIQPPVPGDRSIDLEIRVTTPWGGSGRSMDFVVHSPSGKVPFYQERVQGPLLSAPERFRDQLFEQLRGLQQGLDVDRDPVLASEIHREITTIGHDLYQELFPREMRMIYREIRDTVRTLLITSDEPWIPWEILRPSEAEDDDFLALRFQMGRWLAGENPLLGHKTLRRVLGACAGESDKLAGTDGELGALRDLFRSHPETDAVFRSAASFSELVPLVEDGRFDLIHFAGHGGHRPGQAAEDRILLADRALRARHFTPESEKRLRNRRPFIFFNACQLGRVGRSLTGLDGWAARWVRRFGCSVFLAPLWTVRDSRASRFAQVLYEELDRGRRLGEAVLDARRTLRREDPSDLAWLAYSFYGHPDARIDFGSQASNAVPETETVPETVPETESMPTTLRNDPPPHDRPPASQPESLVGTERSRPTSDPTRGRRGPGATFALTLPLLLLLVLAFMIFRGIPSGEPKTITDPESPSEVTAEKDAGESDGESDPENDDSPSREPEMQNPEPDPSPIPLLPPVPGKVGIVVLDGGSGDMDRETAQALESVLASELLEYAPFAPSLPAPIAERLWQEDGSLFPADDRTPWGAEYLLLARSQRKSLAAPSHISSLSLSLTAKLVGTQPFATEMRTFQTHTGAGPSSHAALTQAATRCTREILETLRER